MNYYRRFVGDYASKTAELSLAEHGAYTILLDVCYSTEKPLPAALDALCRICRAMSRAEQEAVKSIANKFFPIGSDGLRHNSRADEEIGKAQATIAKQRESGVESARKRWSPYGSTHESTDYSIVQMTDGLGNRSAIQPPTTNHHPSTANPQPPEKRASPTGSRLALEILPVEWAEWARQENPNGDPARTFLKFKDHWASVAGAKGRKADWEATWRNWVRREMEFSPAPPAGVDYERLIERIQD